jgi:hypothetical protein
LDAARLESPAPRHVFAAFARSLAGRETHAPFTLQQYEEALERLVLKGLLCIVTPAEIAEQSARNRLAGIPAVRGQGIRSVRQRRFHADRLRRNQGGPPGDLGRQDSQDGLVGMAGRPRCETGGCLWCDRRGLSEEYRSVSGGIGKSERRYAIAQRPSPIGAWSPKRFVVLPSGFHGVLTYTVEPRRV